MNILDRAADLIESYGWVQGRAETITGARCMAGAVRCATGVGGLKQLDLDPEIFKAADDLVQRAFSAVGQELVHQEGFADPLAKSPAQTVISWNDAPGRTVTQVLRILRAAARRLDRPQHPDILNPGLRERYFPGMWPLKPVNWFDQSWFKTLKVA